MKASPGTASAATSMAIRTACRSDHRAGSVEVIAPMLKGLDPLDREYIWGQMGREGAGEHTQCGRHGLVGPGRAIDRTTDPQAAGRLAAAGQGLRQHLRQHGIAGRVCRPCARVPAPGLPGVQDSRVPSNGIRQPGRRPRPGRLLSTADIAICRAVHDAVGDDMVLMLDPWGTYQTYTDALPRGPRARTSRFLLV